MVSYEIEYFNLLKKVRKLETVGLIKSVLVGSKNKHIYLSEKGLLYTSFDSSSEISQDNLTHDLVVSCVLKSLLEREKFVDGRMYHQVSGEHIYPDAEVSEYRKGEYLRLALEIELTQKSQKRVKQKYQRYANQNYFNNVLFITNKKSLYLTYKKYLQEMSEEIRETIILILDDSMKITKSNLDKATCFYMDREMIFNDFFETQKVKIEFNEVKKISPPP